MIDKSKQYRTRDGQEVRIYATDGGGDYPIHGACKVGDDWLASSWRATGEWHLGCDKDLIEAKPRIVDIAIRRQQGCGSFLGAGWNVTVIREGYVNDNTLFPTYVAAAAYVAQLFEQEA